MTHRYTSSVIWTGNRGEGTVSYRGYDRTWDVAVPGKAVIHCSNDPLLGGDPAKMNPEDLLLSALSACHMLWYLHYASDANIIVTGYADSPLGIGQVESSGAGRFTSATLRPRIAVRAGTDIELATAMHYKIHDVCFIARSVNFPITYEPEFVPEL
ncbi:OsmC family protein [Xanthomonas campestris pv. badrii]|uniref:OsmC family protein n=1 Tax=Xanthomonas campestris pv. badrii TaxID=149696 RepID=A0A7Z2VBU8_XANCA|nr:OsmC family protein [Xanthomonas campestris]QJD68764.1 OsmC family protein [Xanthomonas campestris pv. badrii]